MSDRGGLSWFGGPPLSCRPAALVGFDSRACRPPLPAGELAFCLANYTASPAVGVERSGVGAPLGVAAFGELGAPFSARLREAGSEVRVLRGRLPEWRAASLEAAVLPVKERRAVRMRIVCEAAVFQPRLSLADIAEVVFERRNAAGEVGGLRDAALREVFSGAALRVRAEQLGALREVLAVWFIRTLEGDAAAAGVWLKALERQARLVGADAPVEVDVSVLRDELFAVLRDRLAPEEFARVLRAAAGESGPAGVEA